METESIQAQVDEVDGTKEEDDGLGHLTEAAAAEMLQEIQASAAIPVDVAEIYRELATSGNVFGPRFQSLQEVHAGQCCGLGKVVNEDIVQIMPGHYMQPYTIHPITIDAVFQLGAVIFRRECSKAPLMPVALGEMSISLDFDPTPGTEMIVATHLSGEPAVGERERVRLPTAERWHVVSSTHW